MSVLVIDNYDSFTYNLVQYLGELGATTVVVRNDAAGVGELLDAAPSAVVLSPGPGRPEDAGICVAMVHAALARSIPLLGVCLGHQAIGHALGARVVRVEPMHGKRSAVHHQGAGVFAGLPSPTMVTRYHSLAVERASLPAELTVTAWTADGTVMGLRHHRQPVEGVQFHPESVGTDSGHRLLDTFLTHSGVPRQAAARS